MDLVRVGNADLPAGARPLSVYVVRTPYTRVLHDRLPQKYSAAAQKLLAVALWPKLSMPHVLWSIQGLVPAVL